MAAQNDPHFKLFPTATDRTAWRPFGLPVVLVVPYVYDINGNVRPYSQILSLKIFLDVSNFRSPVSGHTHVIRDADGRNIGVYKPDSNLYELTINLSDVANRLIKTNDVTINSDGTFEYTTASGVTSTLEYYSHAQYYDISDFTINTESLETGYYDIVYEVSYYNRKVSNVTGELLCINNEDQKIARFSLQINHPGEVIQTMTEITPSVYFTSKEKSQDTTIGFYRPFTDAIQDVYDEQNYLENINWINNLQPEYIPYLNYILGWEAPISPQQSTNAIYKAMLKNVVRLQKLKGTKRALEELLALFSTSINIYNVWYLPDGSDYIGVNETIDDISITGQNVVTTEPVLYEYDTNGFGEIKAPLINRPRAWGNNLTKNIVYRAALVKKNSTTYNRAQAISTNIGQYDYDLSNKTTNTELPTTITGDGDVEQLMASSESDGLIGHSTLLINDLGESTLLSSRNAPISKIEFNYELNSATFNFSKYYDFTDEDAELYVYATYVYYEVSIPNELDNLQSNKFDVELFNSEGGNIPQQTIPFVLEYIFKIKAFHSLLRKIALTFDINDVYQVTDFSIGGEFSQDPNTDAGSLQIPPEAIAPASEDVCSRDPAELGYRSWDAAYRETILDGLLIEFNAWATINQNQYGQDRTQDTRQQTRYVENNDVYHEDDDRATLPVLNGKDYSYKGRVADTLITSHDTPLPENWRFSACVLMMGNGAYYTYGDGPSSLLHYTNATKFSEHDNINNYLAVQKPSLEIQKNNLLPAGHRFPTMNKVLSTFIHPTLKLRPWDIPLQCTCNEEINDLNAHIITIGGEEYITYNDTAYTIEGNGLTPDIATLGNHDIGTHADFIETDAIHAIYSASDGGHPAVQLNTITIYNGDPQVENISELLYQSGVECGSNYMDYLDGYPSVSGYIDSTDFDVDYFPASEHGTGDTLEVILGVPGGATDFNVLFTLESFIRSSESQYAGYRLDCNCIKLTCDGGTSGTDGISEMLNCAIGDFIDDYYDFSPDKIAISEAMRFDEIINTDLFLLDDPNNILFELKQLNNEVSELGYPADLPFPDSGHFTYKDQYGVIYETSWQTEGEFLDLVVATKQPRIWGGSSAIRTVGNEIFRTGIITTTRTVIKENPDGSWSVIADGSTSEIAEFQYTYVCSDPFIDPFTHKINHSVVDNLAHSLDDGHSWVTEGPEYPSVTHEDSLPILEYVYGTG